MSKRFSKTSNSIMDDILEKDYKYIEISQKDFGFSLYNSININLLDKTIKIGGKLIEGAEFKDVSDTIKEKGLDSCIIHIDNLYELYQRKKKKLYGNFSDKEVILEDYDHKNKMIYCHVVKFKGIEELSKIYVHNGNLLLEFEYVKRYDLNTIVKEIMS